MSGVQVGVRIRPFLPKIDGEDVLCVAMTDTETACTNVLGDHEEKRFTFDYSFWSHDGYDTREDGYTEASPGSNYKDQAYVFEKIGQDVLNNAFQGFHTCLFAYGQTGSGKSHSMIGYGENKGIVPMATDEIFKRIAANTDAETTYEVLCMMCEIYNEKVQDLMIPVNKRPQQGLKIRESKALGIFVDGLSKHAVTSYEEISKVMSTGESHRSKGATLMNAESSRAHTVIQIEFKQMINFKGKKAQKLSVINLIDLAGSEKAGQTGATGDRLKEGCEINKSLSCLGDVIKALVDKQNGKKNLVVPYRNSSLTRMLQNALGGNSKTYMICAIRPGARYFDETVNTLKYADRAKQIKNKAIVNEDPQDKLIRELKAENDRLKKELAAAGGPAQVEIQKDEEAEKQMLLMKEQLEANQRAMAEMEKSWEDKMKEAKERDAEEEQSRQEEEAARLSGTPHLVNLNEDPFLDRKVVYDIKADEPLKCGRRNKNSSVKLQLGGAGIEPEHCEFVTQPDGSVKVIPVSDKAMNNVKVNGKVIPILGLTLHPNDRICIGPSAIFLFKNKQKEAEASMPDQEDDPITFDFAAEEVEKNAASAEKEAQAKLQKEMAEANAAKLAALEAKMEEEKKLHQEEMEKRIAELELAKAAGANEAEQQAMQEQIARDHQEQERLERDKVKRLLAEGIRQKQLQAEYTRVEKQLNELLPLVNEGNLAATELGRDIKFNTKMVKRLDPFLKDGQMSHGRTEILVKVDNNEEKYYYEWAADKFHNRIYMIREILEQYFDSGTRPNLSINEDPFWDPPNPILIGQSFLQLEPLGLQFENQLEASILSIDGQGGKQGLLEIGYVPCNIDGGTDEDDLPEEFTVEDASEVLGLKDLHFKVFIKCARDLPPDLSSNPFVTYQFRFEKDQTYTTKEFQGKERNPEWNYELQHRIDDCTSLVVDELKNGSISFMVYAYPPNALAKLQQVKQDGGAAIKRRMTVRGGRDVENEIDDITKSKILGLDAPEEAEMPVFNPDAPPKSRSGSIGKMERKQSLMGQGKLQGQNDVGNKEFSNGQPVSVVGKENGGSSCCTIF